MVGMGRPVTVAIVDDDAIVRAALVAYLTSTEGLEVRVVISFLFFVVLVFSV